MLLVAANTLPIVAGTLVSVWAACLLHAPSSVTLEGYSQTGLSWTHGDPRVLHWHPILMTLGFVVCGSAAVLGFRTLPFSRSANKAIHGSLHVLAGLISHGGMLAMARYYDEQSEPRKLSLHTALGGLVWALFSCLWIVSFGAFVFPGASSRVRRVAIPHHVAAGVAFVSLVYAASGTGVVAKMASDGVCVGDQKTLECAVGVSICGVLTVGFGMTVAAITRRTQTYKDTKSLMKAPHATAETTLLLRP